MKYSTYFERDEERNQKRERRQSRIKAARITPKTPTTSTIPTSPSSHARNDGSTHPFYLEAKKSLGQNFLKNKTIIKNMVERGEITPHETIVEIGPGTGELTETLLTKGAHVLAIEKDQRAIPILSARFASEISSGQLHIIEGDILEISIEESLRSLKLPLTYKVIANIPYYITGLITRKCLEASLRPRMLIFLVQKEVAERVTEKNKKGSLLSHSIRAYGKAEILCIVSRGNFVPAPKVDSAVLVIHDISDALFTTYGVSEAFFFTILHAGFGHKRKKTIVNLQDMLVDTYSHISTPQMKETLTHIFNTLNLSLTVRSEEIGTETWFKIAQLIHNSLENSPSAI